MTRDEFEFLLSQWLDEPGRTDLGAAVVDAVAAAPDLAAVRDEWVRFDRATRGMIAPVAAIDWNRQAEHIRTALRGEAAATEPADTRLDALLGSLAQPPVDWDKLRGRIASAARGTGRSKPVQRVAWSAALTAAAAIVAFIVLRPSIPGGSQPPLPIRVAIVHVSSPAAFDGPARVQVTVGRVAGESQSPSKPAAESEFFLMIDPAPSDSATQVSAMADDEAGRVARASRSAVRTAMID